jgi:hypothetical protein
MRETQHMERTVIMGKLHFDVWAKETMASRFLKSVHKNDVLKSKNSNDIIIRKTERINKNIRYECEIKIKSRLG